MVVLQGGPKNWTILICGLLPTFSKLFLLQNDTLSTSLAHRY